jgi:hypothetical protein
LGGSCFELVWAISTNKLSVVVIPVVLVTQRPRQEELSLRSAPGINVRLCQKN